MNDQADSENMNMVIKSEKAAASSSPSASSVPSSKQASAPFVADMIQNLPPTINVATAEKQQNAFGSPSPATYIPSSHQVSARPEQEQKIAASSTLGNHNSTQSNAMDIVVEKGKTTASSSPADTICGNYKVSSQFNAKDADTTFQSADNVLYHVHGKNLECAATGFPKAKTNSDKHIIIQMTEESDTLDLLFGFTYPRPTPNVKDLPFETLRKLASAAEKYKVYSAITICHIYMSANVEQHPISVLRYSASYRYVELLDIAAPIAIQERLGVVVSKLPPDVAIAWVYYYQEWHDAVEELTDPQRRPSSCTCTAWPSICLGILDRIGGKVQSLFDLDGIFAKPSTGCLKCLSNVTIWHDQANKIYANMPQFSEYLFPKPSTTNTGVGRKKSRKATPTPSTTSAGDRTRGSMLQSIISAVGHDQARGDAANPVFGHVQARANAPESGKRVSLESSTIGAGGGMLQSIISATAGHAQARATMPEPNSTPNPCVGHVQAPASTPESGKRASLESSTIGTDSFWGQASTGRYKGRK